jgi:RimJ/RimL family protein N-acetyltransferase
MSAIPQLTTERLILRPWREEDRAALARLNADPRVMEYFPDRLTTAESDAMFDRMVAHWAQHGFGLWALELRGGAPCIGFTGLSCPRFSAPFTPCVEIGWRLAAEHWGKGYATEAARASFEHGFGRLGLKEIVSFTAVGNERSRRVMERLGMSHDPADRFDHPLLAANHPLRPHVLYRLRSG